MDEVLDVEEPDRAVREPARDVAIRESYAPASVGVGVVLVGQVEEVQRGVRRPPCAEVLGRPMPVHELVAPRGAEAVSPAPDATSEAMPEEIGARDCPPRGRNLQSPVKFHAAN